MKPRRILFSAALVAVFTSSAMATETGPLPPRMSEQLMAQRQSCKAVSSCQEAVEMWCGGYSRADGDDDGIPCENVCSSRREVERIRQAIGC